jgi:NTE family protein
MNFQGDYYKSYLNILLRESLIKIFGPLQEEILLEIEEKVEWLRIKAGIELFHQDDTGLHIYFVLIGKVTVKIESPDHELIFSVDIHRGETVGEVSMLTGEKRSATIIAARDSVLVSLSKEEYEFIIHRYPFLARAIAKHAIQRLILTQNPRKLPPKPSTICLLPISKGLDLNSWMDRLVAVLTKRHTIRMIDKKVIDHVWSDYIPTESMDTDEIEDTPVFQSWLDEQEAQHTFLLFNTDGLDSAWTKKCLNISDTIFLIADATQDPQISLSEKELYLSNHSTKYLVLIHPEETLFPLSTGLWLQDRKIKTHIHLRANHDGDLQRLSRIISGRANGLVLSGGGAKGFAHLGVYQALLERGIPIDFVGGTSVGALMGAFISFGLSPERIKEIVRTGALQNPTSDYSLFPFLSIIKGKRMSKLIKKALDKSVGFDIHIEDTWLNFFAVSSNYTESKPMIHTRGRLFDALLASVSIPGAFPPVLMEQELLMDGGTFNNFPTDIMNNEMQITNIIGVELLRDKIKRIDLEQLPTGWQLFLDKLKPKRQRKYNLPSLMSILLNAALFYSDHQRKELRNYADIYFSPEVRGFNMMDWNSFDTIFDKGYQHAISVLNKMTEEELDNFKS